uniref:Uncharacterized protein n=1 Tax=Plectus sambesii TaxID=2011161 RepID=A0A914W1Z1_9BILA
MARGVAHILAPDEIPHTAQKSFDSFNEQGIMPSTSSDTAVDPPETPAVKKGSHIT